MVRSLEGAARAPTMRVSVIALSALMSACSTADLVGKFNGGLLDSTGDANHDPSARHRSLVKQLIVHEMMDGYFTQGDANGRVANWLAFAAADAGAFVTAVHQHAKYTGNSLGVVSVDTVTPALRTARIAAARSYQDATGEGVAPKERFRSLGAYYRRTPLAAGVPLCKDGKLDAGQAGEVADAVRFDAALERAGAAVTALAIEGLANLAEVKAGAKDAFIELRRYLGERRWQRRFDRHVNGLVVKGGASTGMYSAGVVWMALNLIDRCLDDATCKAATGDPRFTLISGTSTGAMIAVVTDLFNNAQDHAGRQKALAHLAGWFTCTGSSELYCVRDANALEMLKRQRGLIEFDGLENLLGQNVDCNALRNESELVLNTVDFRTGNLYDLSDQNELRRPVDVVQGALASAVLPFIAKPIPHLPVDYAPTKVEQTYLDGGIRAELPILPLVRRGAERVLVVASSASVTSEMRDLPSGLDIAIRYIDVSTGGVTESEIAHAERQVESVRLAEMFDCQQSDAVTTGCGNDAGCIAAFCESRWDDVCRPADERVRPPNPNPLDLTGQRLGTVWQTRSFFRDEDRVEQLHGYDFDPVKQRQLFQAGVDAARLRCRELAVLFGMPTANVASWCTPALPECPAGVEHSASLRNCSEPPAPASAEVCR